MAGARGRGGMLRDAASYATGGTPYRPGAGRAGPGWRDRRGRGRARTSAGADPGTPSGDVIGGAVIAMTVRTRHRRGLGSGMAAGRPARPRIAGTAPGQRRVRRPRPV